MSTQLPEKYKTEITEILSRISKGLGESVIEKILPEVRTIETNVQDICNTVEKIGQSIVTFEQINAKNHEELQLSEAKTHALFSENFTAIVERLDIIESQDKIEAQLNELLTKQRIAFRNMILVMSILVVITVTSLIFNLV